MSRAYYPPTLQAAPQSYLGMSLANTPVVVISRPMPQQPRRRPRKPSDRRKRYGVIFTSDPLRGVFEDDDDESTWSMSRSRSSRRMTTSRATSVRTRNSSPAQEIAARYRASHSSDERTRPRPRASSSVTYLSVPSAEALSAGSSMDTELSTMSGPRLRFRESRVSAIDQAAREAYVMAIRWGLDRDIPCQRPGCRDILPNIRSLATHLTIHDIDPRERYAQPPPYSSFLDFGHSVEGRQQRRYAPSPAPYAHSSRARSKIRKYLSMLTCRCISCSAPRDDF
ncbi:hypothetical protein BV20DRAFT_970164 [Pilatotrama ljubarskyi]|nr:hypothetical protein BV20DRAFT_970164 [Pilatotrama ljubarskyi]